MKAGSTSVSLPIFVQDSSSTTGAGLSLAFDAAGLVGEYRRKGSASWSTITLSAGTLGTWSDGGWIADGSLTGAYEVGIPDSAIAAGQPWVAIRFRGATNMLPVLIEIELDAIDYQDTVRLGLTALPNVAAGGSGGLLINGSNTGTVVLAALTVTGALTATGGIIGDITGNLSGSVGSVTLISANGITASSIADNSIDAGAFASGALDAVWSTTARTITGGTITTYTGNTVQTGDSFSRIGALGVGLTALAQATQIPTVSEIRIEMDANSTELSTAAVSSAAVLAAINIAQIVGAVNDVSPTSTAFNGNTELSTVDGYYGTSSASAFLVFTSGLNLGIGRTILTYTGSTRRFTFTNPFPATITNTDTFKIVGVSE